MYVSPQVYVVHLPKYIYVGNKRRRHVGGKQKPMIIRAILEFVQREK